MSPRFLASPTGRMGLPFEMGKAAGECFLGVGGIDFGLGYIKFTN